MVRRRTLLILLALYLVSGGPGASSRAAASPRVRRVLLVSIDGLRPDVLLHARAPVLRNLMDQGCFTLWARTTAVAVTLPSHASMLTGVAPDKHQFVWNTDLPLAHPVLPARPTLFELATRAGLTTASDGTRRASSPRWRLPTDASGACSTRCGDRGLADSTAVFVSSDHGGAGTSHGPDDVRSRRIPWIASGPGIRKNVDLTLDVWSGSRN